MNALISSSKRPRNKIKKIKIQRNLRWLAIKETFKEYAAITKVNGLYYLAPGMTSGLWRIFWSVTPILFCIFGTLMTALLYEKYLDSPTSMTIGKPMNILRIPFPAVTICHPQNVMDYKIERFLSKIKIPKGIHRTRIANILPLIGGFTERQWVKPNTNDLTILNDTLALNQISIKAAIMELGTTCEDFILECRFAGVTFPCFQDQEHLTWKTSTSNFGACCSFNYHPNRNNVKYVPFVSNTFGIYGGLSIIGTGYPQIADGKSGDLFSAGLMLQIHHTMDFANEGAQFALLKMGRQTFIDVTPTDSRCSRQVLELPFSHRKCILTSDMQDGTTDGNEYRQPYCAMKCYRDVVYKTCNCHPYQLPRDPNNSEIKECGIMDVQCFVDNYFKFQTIKCNICLPSCSDVTYTIFSYVVDYGAINFTIDNFYRKRNMTNNDFVAHVYFTGQTGFANRKIMAMSWISLLSNLGGVFNLCFGVSLLSLIEILYYIFVRYHAQYKLVSKPRPKRVTQLQIFHIN